MKLELRNVDKTYYRDKEKKVQVLRDVSIKFPEGKITAVVGKSGSGKSSLLHILGLLEKPDAGEYIWNDEIIDFSKDNDISKMRNKNIGYIMQDYALVPKMSVWDNISIPLYIAKSNFEKVNERIRGLTNILDIEKLLNMQVSKLSGGEQQRVAIARAMVMQPEILLADEPTGALDSQNAKQIMDMFKYINGEYNTTIILVTHDLVNAEKCNFQIGLDSGKLFFKK